MRKKLLIGVGGCILLVILWLLYDYYHYAPPNLSDDQISRLAEKQLQSQSRQLLDTLSGDPSIQREPQSLKVLRVGKIRGKTYLVFKLDFTIKSQQPGGPYDYDNEAYLLGLRLVEKRLGGLAFKDGMEFDNSLMMGTAPLDCGRHPDGVFYAYCKDPRVNKIVLESDSGIKYSALAENRVILAQVPPGRQNLFPRFYTPKGEEVMPSNNFRIAFISQDQKAYQAYTNVPVQWWALAASDVDYLKAGNVDAVWIFPDQQNAALAGDALTVLKKLVQDGVPVLLVNGKDPAGLARLLNIVEMAGTGSGSGEMEATFAGMNPQGKLQAGAITLDDEQGSPFLHQSIVMRYQIDDHGFKPAVTAEGVEDSSTVSVPTSSGKAVVKMRGRTY